MHFYTFIRHSIVSHGGCTTRKVTGLGGSCRGKFARCRATGQAIVSQAWLIPRNEANIREAARSTGGRWRFFSGVDIRADGSRPFPGALLLQFGAFEAGQTASWPFDTRSHIDSAPLCVFVAMDTSIHSLSHRVTSRFSCV